ncbi:hypothetical protein GCM10009827_072350 [Dactylosporangium maewongense]|uniref:Integral membrane protein n=1 Tax=Dactylosporangium maewongense TaxID=634393 RepID=A0ABN2BKM6_9ACTN
MRPPIVLGLASTGTAVAGLSILLYATYVGVRDARVVRHLFPTLTAEALAFMLPAGLLVVGLLAGAALALAGRDAGRCALVWLCGMGIGVAVLFYMGHLTVLFNWDHEVWIGPPRWVGGLGALLAVLGLVAGAVSLGIPPARRAFAGTQAPLAEPETGAVAGTVASAVAVPELPASLRGAAVWLRVGGGSGAAGSAGVAALSVAAGDTVGAAMAVSAAVGVLACAAGAGAAATTARQRRRGAAQLARAAAAVVLALLLLALQLCTIYVVGWVVWAETTGPTGFDPVVVPMIVAVVVGIVATLAGLASLADPRSERFMVQPHRPQYVTWGSWAPAAQRSPEEAAPVDGYTVP